MRIIGYRKERLVSLHASGDLLLEGARFNDEIHRLLTGQITGIPKGIYRFKTHEEANRQQEECLARAMAEITQQRQP